MIRELAALPPSGLGQPLDEAAFIRTLSLLADWIEARYTSVTAAYTVSDETHVLADATGGAFTVTINNTAEAANRIVTVKRLNAGGNNVTVALSSGNIDGAATLVLNAQYQSRSILLDGTNGHVVGAHL